MKVSSQNLVNLTKLDHEASNSINHTKNLNFISSSNQIPQKIYKEQKLTQISDHDKFTCISNSIETQCLK